MSSKNSNRYILRRSITWSLNWLRQILRNIYSNCMVTKWQWHSLFQIWGRSRAEMRLQSQQFFTRSPSTPKARPMPLRTNTTRSTYRTSTLWITFQINFHPPIQSTTTTSNRLNEIHQMKSNSNWRNCKTFRLLQETEKRDRDRKSTDKLLSRLRIPCPTWGSTKFRSYQCAELRGTCLRIETKKSTWVLPTRLLNNEIEPMIKINDCIINLVLYQTNQVILPSQSIETKSRTNSIKLLALLINSYQKWVKSRNRSKCRSKKEMARSKLHSPTICR